MSGMKPRTWRRTPGVRESLDEPALTEAARVANCFPGAGNDVGNIMKAEYGLNLPPGLQIDFAQVVQAHADSADGRSDVGQIGEIFDDEYIVHKRMAALLLQCTASRASVWLSYADLVLNRSRFIRRPARDPAVLCAERLAVLGAQVGIISRYSHRMGTSGRFVVYVQCMVGSPTWGVGIADDAVSATLRAMLSAIGRSRRITEGRCSS
jgi:2-isopropylmalate synthase